MTTDRGERTLVTTLTKKMAGDLTNYLIEHGVRVRYLHSDIDTLERIQIIRELRLGSTTCWSGSTCCVRASTCRRSRWSRFSTPRKGSCGARRGLIQTIGRAARNTGGRVLMYGDKETEAMRSAISETDRRRASRSLTTNAMA